MTSAAKANGNGTLHRVLDRLDDVESEVSEEQKYVREQFGFVREELRDIKAVLDVLLKMAKVQEEREEQDG